MLEFSNNYFKYFIFTAEGILTSCKRLRPITGDDRKNQEVFFTNNFIEYSHNAMLQDTNTRYKCKYIIQNQAEDKDSLNNLQL